MTTWIHLTGFVRQAVPTAVLAACLIPPLGAGRVAAATVQLAPVFDFYTAAVSGSSYPPPGNGAPGFENVAYSGPASGGGDFLPPMPGFPSHAEAQAAIQAAFGPATTISLHVTGFPGMSYFYDPEFPEMPPMEIPCGSQATAQVYDGRFHFAGNTELPVGTPVTLHVSCTNPGVDSWEMYVFDESYQIRAWREDHLQLHWTIPTAIGETLWIESYLNSGGDWSFDNTLELSLYGDATLVPEPAVPMLLAFAGLTLAMKTNRTRNDNRKRP
jgi:hypothetical protein